MAKFIELTDYEDQPLLVNLDNIIWVRPYEAENGTGDGVKRIYYYFIRHQGEQEDAYDAWTADNIDETKSLLCPSTPTMNFGIVRNNIYRISIEKITEDSKIKVKMWDKFTHSTIYM